MANVSRRDAFLGAAALAACTPNQISASMRAEPDQLADIADSVVRPALAQEGMPGASFVAFDARGRIATRHWGLADREAGRTTTDETIWPIASITKTLTATAAMTLVDRHRVDLDADITTYLRDTDIPPFAGPPITLRRLLSHTAGFDEVRGRMCTLHDAPEAL
ncbi:MAG TPA: serine hydrolase domain-containing protein, partial [Vitreimonas sp.]|nr:serine hydrolase domain-containing protein [Vitreimonas sp.]